MGTEEEKSMNNTIFLVTIIVIKPLRVGKAEHTGKFNELLVENTFIKTHFWCH